MSDSPCSIPKALTVVTPLHADELIKELAMQLHAPALREREQLTKFRLQQYSVPFEVP